MGCRRGVYVKLPYIPSADDTLDHKDYEPGRRGKEQPCTNPLHRTQIAGWCARCDGEWDRTGELTEEQMKEMADADLQALRLELIESQEELDRLKKVDPRNVVKVVEARKRRNDARDKIERLGYHWRTSVPTKRDNL